MFPKTDHTKMGMKASHGHIELSCRMSPCQSQKYRLFSFVYLSKYVLLYIACLQTAENELTIITTEAGFKLANVRLTNVLSYGIYIYLKYSIDRFQFFNLEFVSVDIIQIC